MAQKIAVITGGNGYLGRTVSGELQERGWLVISLSRSSVPGGFECDVSDKESVQSTIVKVIEKYGQIDAIIHAASPKLERVTEEKASVESAQEHMKVALNGALNLLEVGGPYVANNGVFIGITSSAVRAEKQPAMGGYIAAKRAMEEYLAERAVKEKRFRIATFEVDFLPGGLNNDLPRFALEMFSKKSESVESVAKRIVDICEA